MKLDLDYKEEKINSLTKEIEELSHGGASEEEIASLKRQRADLDNRLKDQEEELDDLAGQVQMLEAAKTKLEMSMAALKKEHRRELASKEEELEDVRAAAQKKVKVLEQQLENEHEERINFVREKHELETRIINLQEMASRSADEEQVSKLKKDLKRTKALLKDAQLMVEKSRNESSNKVVLRQLKNQVSPRPQIIKHRWSDWDVTSLGVYFCLVSKRGFAQLSSAIQHAQFICKQIQ